MKKKQLLFVCLILLLSSVQAYDVKSQTAADLKFCTGYSPLSANSADLQYSDSCGAVANTCTYTSGNWQIDCSENCTIDVNTDVGGNNITFDGVGVITMNANVSNWVVGRIQGSCSVIQTPQGSFKQ